MIARDNLKPLPYTPTKKQLVKMYNGVNTSTLLDEIRHIMSKHRGEPEEKILRKRIILHPEFIELIRFIGMPPGYYLPEGFFVDICAYQCVKVRGFSRKSSVE